MRAADLRRSLDEIAGPEPDLGAARVAVRSRVRRRRTTTTVVVVALLVLAAIPIAADVHLSSNGTSIGSDPQWPTSEHGSRRIESSHYGFAVDVPADWIGHASDDDHGEIMPLLFTAKSRATKFPNLMNCAAWGRVDTVFVRVQELGYTEPLDIKRPRPLSPATEQSNTYERPMRFGPQYGLSWSQCAGSPARLIQFNERGRGFAAYVFAGGKTPKADVDRAYRVLDSFRVGAPTLSTFCTNAYQLFPSSNVYDEDPLARLSRVAQSWEIAAALHTAEPALRDPDLTSKKRQRQPTEAERKALRIVDDALDECGLGNEIFAPWARSLQ